MFQIEDGKLITAEGVTIFNRPIHSAIELSNVILVRLKIMTQTDDIRNIFGVKKDGSQWQVQAFKDFHPRYDSPLMEYECFTGIHIYDKDPNLAIATTAGGFRFLIDPQTGKIVGTESWVK